MQDDISFPMAFNQANSTLEDEADEKALEFDRCTSDPNMDSVLPTLQESVARFGLHNLRRYNTYPVLSSLSLLRLSRYAYCRLCDIKIDGRSTTQQRRPNLRTIFRYEALPTGRIGRLYSSSGQVRGFLRPKCRRR